MRKIFLKKYIVPCMCLGIMIFMSMMFIGCSGELRTDSESTAITTTISETEENDQQDDMDLPENALNIETVEVVIPGVEKEQDFIFLSDLHIVVNDAYVDEEEREFMEDRKQSFANPGNGMVSAEYWLSLAEILDGYEGNIQGYLFGADMVDFASPSTMECLKQGLDALTHPYMYVRADHDYAPYWCSSVAQEDMNALHQELDGAEAMQYWEYDEFVIMGWDNSTSQMTPEVLDEARNIIAKDKPIILLTHVPLESRVDESLSTQSKEVWQDRALVWGEECTYNPDETTKAFLDMVYQEDSLFVEVLSGHLHFTWDGYIAGGIHQHVFSPAFGGNVGLIQVTGEEPNVSQE